MTDYELMVKTNHYLIRDGVLTGEQQRRISRQFLESVSRKENAESDSQGVDAPRNWDGCGRRMCPLYFIPPQNGGKKFPTILTQVPGTQILSANAYELEILRLLRRFEQNNEEVGDMVGKTLERLKTTCFGFQDDGMGECFEASLVVLRFLAGAAPEEGAWMESRMENFRKHYMEKHRHWATRFYYWLCLSELPMELAEPEIKIEKDEMVYSLLGSYPINSDYGKKVHPLKLFITRNALSRLKEYEYIRERKPFINQKSWRMGFDIG